MRNSVVKPIDIEAELSTTTRAMRAVAYMLQSAPTHNSSGYVACIDLVTFEDMSCLFHVLSDRLDNVYDALADQSPGCEPTRAAAK